MKINNRYTFNVLSDQIGSGSFGDCYRATDHYTNKTVCVKVIKID